MRLLTGLGLGPCFCCAALAPRLLPVQRLLLGLGAIAYLGAACMPTSPHMPLSISAPRVTGVMVKPYLPSPVDTRSQGCPCTWGIRISRGKSGRGLPM